MNAASAPFTGMDHHPAKADVKELVQASEEPYGTMPGGADPGSGVTPG